MPTNLPPEYFAIEREFRAAETVQEQIALLEQLISVVPKHKGTDHLRADLRRKLSKLKERSQARKDTGRRQSVFRIEKEGVGQVAVVGAPNVGKSALVAALTNATPEVSESPYTTWEPTPGMMPIEDIQVQLIDTPPLYREYVEPRLMDLLRRVDLILVVVDLQTHPVEQLEQTLALLKEHRIWPLRHQDRYEGERQATFKPFLMVANKADDDEAEELFELFRELLEEDWPCIPVSAQTGRNLDRLKQAVFERLDVIRIYAKPPGQPPDLSAPFVTKRGSRVEEFAGRVHKDFVASLVSARVWGSAEFDGQSVGRDYVLQDGDIVELRT
jgi:small GTP-binding protein